MREPRRWLDASEATPEGRLLRAVVDEPLPSGALERAGKRFGVSATLLGTASASVAKAAAASSATVGVKAGASVLGSSALVATVAKSIVVGVGVAATITGGMHWAAQNHDSSASASSSAPKTISPAKALVAPRTRAVESPGPEVPVPSATQPAPSDAVLPEQDVRGTPPAPIDAGASMPGGDTRALARFDDSSFPRDTYEPSTDAGTSVTWPALAETGSRTDDSRLAREVSLLDEVRLALRQGNAALALERLEQGKQQGLIRMLDHEASLLRVEALAQAGRSAEAAALARRLLARGVSPSQKRALERWLESLR